MDRTAAGAGVGGKWAKVWYFVPLEASRALTWRAGCWNGMEMGQQPVAPPMGCSHPVVATAEEHCYRWCCQRHHGNPRNKMLFWVK